MIETVGSGQAETNIRDLVDVLIYATSPYSGDWLQAIKRGITEVADILLITKCDIDPNAAKRAIDELNSSCKPEASILAVSTQDQSTIDGLWTAIFKIFIEMTVRLILRLK